MEAVATKSASATLVGSEVRCPNKVVKHYDGKEKLKVCGALLAIVELNLNGSGSVTVHTKCMKQNCKQMVHYTISK